MYQNIYAQHHMLNNIENNIYKFQELKKYCKYRTN